MRLQSRTTVVSKFWWDLTLENNRSVGRRSLHIVLRKRRPQECVIVPRRAPANLWDIEGGKSSQAAVLTASRQHNHNGGLTRRLPRIHQEFLPKYLKQVYWNNQEGFFLKSMLGRVYKIIKLLLFFSPSVDIKTMTPVKRRCVCACGLAHIVNKPDWGNVATTHF